jgi:serine/threonine protein kinase
MGTCCGSPTYVAPEILTASGYGNAVDMWSLGVITYFMLCGFPPFLSENVAELFDAIINQPHEYPAEYFDQISQQAKDFIELVLCSLFFSLSFLCFFFSSCLSKDASNRLTAVNAMKHPWLNGRAGVGKVKGDRLRAAVLERHATRMLS